MNTSFNERKDEIIEKLNTKEIKCGSCDSKQLTLISGFSTIDLSENINTRQMGGNGIPCINLVCTNCGCIHQYAIKALLPNF